MITDYETRIRVAPHGEERLELYRAAIKEADEDGDFLYRFYRRTDYISESVFHSDGMEALVVFPKAMQIFDEEAAKGLTDAEDCKELMWSFKYLLDACRSYYQVGVKQFEDFLEEYKKRCLAYGFSLRTYYRIMMDFYRRVDSEKEAEGFNNFPKGTRDRLSDCAACDLNSEVEYLLYHGERKAAREKAQKLFSRIMHCSEVPEITYEAFTLDSCKRIAGGEIVNIEEAEEMCLNYANGIRYRNKAVDGFGIPMLYYALTGSNKALPWFKKYSTTFESFRGPVYKFYFAMGAVAFLNSLGKENYKMKLNTDYPFYNEDNVYNVKQLAEYYYKFALDVATKLDGRNGTDSFKKELDLFCNWQC
ncbi:MAG: hypothetical protein K6G72_12995 [Lachnospiraceae bacterium]|nr:hypothetical protein [Lachnospiraceae bacterium]